jgi:hypothetical protein
MKSLRDYLSQVTNESNGPQEGHYFDLVLNEELAIKTDIVAVEDDRVFIGLDESAFKLLEAAGLMELADDPGYQGATGTPLGGKPATPAAAAAQTPQAGARNPAAGAKPMQNAAGLRQAQQSATAAGSPAPTPGYSKKYPATDAMTTKMAQSVSGKYGTSTPPAAPKATGGGAPANNPQQAAVDAANAVQRGQMDNLQGNQPAARPDTDAMKQGIAAGPQTATATSEPAPQAGALGVMPQANVPGSPTATAEPTAEPTPAPQAGALGVMPQANVPGSPTATAQPAAASTATPNAVKSGTGQDIKTGTGGTVTTRTPDEIAAANKTPMGQYNPNQATKSYSSVGDFASAIGNKLREDSPGETVDSGDFNRMLELAGVRRG